MQIRRTRANAAVLVALFALTAGGCDYFVSPEARVEQARSRAAKGEWRAAVVELKNALQKNPELHEGRLLLAEAALWLGDPASADAELQRVPAHVDAAAIDDLRARIDLAMGRQDALLSRLAAGGDALSPAQREMYRGLALLKDRSRANEAEAALQRALELDPKLMAAHTGLIEALALQGEGAKALESAATLAERYPESAEAAFAHGMLLARSDREAGLAELERARGLAPMQLDYFKRSMLLASLFDMQLANGRVDLAKLTSDELARLNPGSPLAALMASRVAMASNDYVAAAAELRRLVNAAPQFAQARFMLGVALAAQGNLEQASQELSRVVEQTPELLEARQLLAQVRMRLNDPDGALQVLVPGLESTGSQSQLTTLLDAARAQGGAKSIDVLERALAASRDNKALEVQLAAAYLQSGAAAKALALLRKLQAGPLDLRREALLLQATLITEGAQRAREHLDALLKGQGADARVLALGSAFLAHVGDVDAGRRLLTSRLAADAKAYELYLPLAQLEWAARRPAAAREALQKLVTAAPEDSRARLALAELELSTGRRAEARTHLEEVRKREPKEATARLLLANLALAEDRGDDAQSLIAEALQNAPNGAEIRARAGLMYIQAARYDQAIQHLQAGLKLDPGAPVLWLQLGRAQLALNQQASARESFERALAIQPQWLPAEAALAFLDLQANAQDAALARAAALRQSRPQDPAVAALEGQLHSTLRRYTEAAAAFDRARVLQPSAALAYGSFQARLLGQLPQPYAPLEEWLQIQPNDIVTRNVLAEAYTRAGERPKAIGHYERIVAAQPQNVAVLNNLAWLYYETKDPRALELARRASSAAPDAAAVSDTLGWILVESGRIDEGLPLLERAASQAAVEPEIGFHYGAALIRAGQTDQGMQYLRRLLKEHAAFPSRAQAQQLASGVVDGA